MIQFVTINVDGEKVSRTFSSKEELEREWMSENCDLPAGDDEVLCAEANGLTFAMPGTFDNLLRILGIIR